MDKNIRNLKARYPFLEIGTAGKSVMGRNLYYIRMGSGPHEVFYTASIHANEWITTPLLMKFAEDYSQAYSVGAMLKGYNIADLWNRSSIYVIPMLNPDGVDLVLKGITPENPYYQFVNEINKTGYPIPRVWKANIRGVDLDLNFPADWDNEKQLEVSKGITGPAPAGYCGPFPLSEPETSALAAFTAAHDFKMVIEYHTQGNVIYYRYQNLTPPESRNIALLFSYVSGLSVSENAGESPYAGYKDWFISEYGKPGFSIHVGVGPSPIPASQFDRIYSENEEILLLGAVIQ